MTDRTQKTGGCLCGAVRFTARNVPTTFGVCHCEMCRRWTGSALLGVSLAEGDVTWEKNDTLKVVQTSRWAERGFCDACGSGMFFRVTLEGKYAGEIELPIGAFDDASGFEMSHEIYIDHKPDSYGYDHKGHKVLTRAECVEKFPVLGDDE